MKTHYGLAVAILLLGTSGAAVAQDQAPVNHVQLIPDNGPQPQGLITCWYNANGAYTGSDSAQPGAQPGVTRSGSGWADNIAAPNGQSCPQSLPPQ
jgi:hypothetical protein